jgi:hypothetical protein
MQSEYCISPFVIIYFLVTIAITTVTFTLTIDKGRCKASKLLGREGRAFICNLALSPNNRKLNKPASFLIKILQSHGIGVVEKPWHLQPVGNQPRSSTKPSLQYRRWQSHGTVDSFNPLGNQPRSSIKPSLQYGRWQSHAAVEKPRYLQSVRKPTTEPRYLN